MTCYLFGLPGLSVLSPHLKECIGLHLNSPFLHHGLTLMAVSWSNHSVPLICFLTLRDHCLSTPDVQCLKNYCFIYEWMKEYIYVFSFGYFIREVNPVNSLGISNRWQLTILFEMFLCFLPSHKGLRTGYLYARFFLYQYIYNHWTGFCISQACLKFMGLSFLTRNLVSNCS